jgi:hypothetical protein
MVGLSLLAASNAPAFGAESKLFPCVEVQPPPVATASCPLEIFPPISVSTIRVDAGDGKADSAHRPQFVSASSAPNAYSVALLIDEAADVSQTELARIKGVFGGVLTSGAANTDYGFWAFATETRQISDFGTAPETVRLTFDSVQPKGKTVELLRGLHEVGKRLSATSAKRKVLIVGTLADYYDTAYSLTEIIDSLNASGIRVFFIYPRRGDEARTEAQTLRRIGDETGGQLLQAFDQASVQSAVNFIVGYMNRSGEIAVSEAEKQTKLVVDLSDGKTLTAAIPATVPVSPAPSSPAETLVSPPAAPSPAAESPLSVPTPVATPQPVPVWSATLDWFDAQSIALRIAVGVAAIMLIAVIGTMIVAAIRHRRTAQLYAETEQALSSNDSQTTVGDLRPAFAWLQFLESNESQEPIHQDVTRIGRQKDNDIILPNTTVHRHHAILRRDPGGGFAMMDLDTVNGVVVNGKKVKSCKLTDGDVIELGEVRMRFKVA